MSFMPVFERRFTTDGIDAKVVQNVPLFMNNSTSDFIISGSATRCTAATSISSGPTLGVGTGIGTNDILASVSITPLKSAGQAFNFQMIGMANVVPPGATLYLNISGAATGTSQTISVDVTGYWI